MLTPLSVNELHEGRRYYMQSNDGKYRPVTYLGVTGHYDSYPILSWREKDGEVRSSYSFLFWEKDPAPLFRVQYRESWGEWFDWKSTTKGAATRLANRMRDERGLTTRVVPA